MNQERMSFIATTRRTSEREITKAHSPVESKILAQFYCWLADLYFLAVKLRALRATNARLKEKLDNPELSRHSKHAEYVSVYAQREVEVAMLERMARPYIQELAAIWQRLPVETQERIYREETDWPQERHPVRLAAAVFRWMTSDAFLWPGKTEHPF